MSAKPPRAARPRKAKASPPVGQSAGSGVVPDGFYRDMVWNLRNGVIAITRDGRVAVMNDIAYRTLGLKPRSADIGRHYSEVLKDCPDVCRIVGSAFDLSHLPNRAELRLRNTEQVIGYTLSHVKDARGRDVGANVRTRRDYQAPAMFDRVAPRPAPVDHRFVHEPRQRWIRLRMARNRREHHQPTDPPTHQPTLH